MEMESVWNLMTVTVGIPISLYKALQDKAEEKETSVDELVRKVLEWYVDEA